MKKIQLLIVLICYAGIAVALSFYPVPPAPVITSSKGNVLCSGDSTVLTATSAGATNYLWSTGATTQSITVNAAGIYTATASNASGNSAPGIKTITAISYSQSVVKWQKCLGGSNVDRATSIQQTFGGGYIVAGYTLSNDGNVSGNHGGSDCWIVKFNKNGTIQWQKCFGGSGNDVANSIQQTSDSGYIVAGYTSSNDGDVSGNHGSNDFWIVKLNKNGTIQWQKCLGGSNSEGANSIQQTSDGGYIVAGNSNSIDGDVTVNLGSSDYWIVKMDSTGNIQWQKSRGGSDDDYALSIQQTSDGGYIVAGHSWSNNGNVSGNHFKNDYWIIKLSPAGTMQWQKCLGGRKQDVAYSIQQTPDGGYIVAGSTCSNGWDVKYNHSLQQGYADCWIVKLDSAGNIQWQKPLGGYFYDEGRSIQLTSDGGYIVAGYTRSIGADVSGNHGSSDYWIVKLDTAGIIQWQKSFGGSDFDYAESIQQTADGGYIVAGSTKSNNGNVSGNHGGYDYWIVKLFADGACPAPSSGFNTSDITATSAKVNWDIIKCADHYKLHYRVAGTTTWTWKRTNVNKGYKPLNGLAPSTSYEWQVSTVCDDPTDKISYFSGIQNFTTAALREGETIAVAYPISNCSAFPNPTKGNVTLSFTSDDNLKGSIEIYNTVGEMVLHHSIAMTEGENSTELDLNHAPPGIYFLNIKTANGVYRQKLVKE